jgi:hypothetical protein
VTGGAYLKSKLIVQQRSANGGTQSFTKWLPSRVSLRNINFGLETESFYRKYYMKKEYNL